MKKIFMLFILSIFLIGIVYAEELLPWYDGDAKSNKDPIFIELPSTIHQMMPVTAKVYINDETIKKEAKYVEISSGSAPPYSLKEQIYFDPSGNFRQTIEYNGQDVIEYGFRPSEYSGQSSSTSVTFYKIKKVEGKTYPDTYSSDSEFKNYNCHTETNKLLCDSKDGCIVCNQPIGSAMREYHISKSVDSVSPPSKFSFKNIKDSDSYLKEYSPQYESFSYSEDRTVTDNQGNKATYTDTYTITLDVTSNQYSLKSQKDSSLGAYMEKQQGMTLKDISPPGGLTGGYAFEGVKYAPSLDANRGYDYVSLIYEMYSEMSPVGSGIMKVVATRSTTVPTGSAESEKEAIISEAKAFAASYKLNAGQVLTPDRTLINRYSVRRAEKPIQEPTELTLYGTVSNFDDNPMPFIELEARANGMIYNGKTDANGDFSILLTNLELEPSEELECKLKVSFSYERDGKNYFKVYNKANGNNYKLVTATKKFKIKGGENYELHLKLDGKVDPDLTTNLNPASNLKHFAVIYFHTHEAVDFSLTKLNANIDYKLPVEIYVGNLNKDTLYSPTDSSILISADDGGYGSSNKPKNREYHEFSHHLMYATYNAWPAGGNAAGVSNHDGFLNPNTGDSYIEGFAEFMALAISKENGDKNPDIYADFGSLENNFKPWDSNGALEEFAIASLLWDMYDSNNEKGDSLTMSLNDIWKVLKVQRADFYEYYKAFKTTYPKDADKIDSLFIAHGIFEDTRLGNKKYDSGEPWKYINQTAGTYNFIDMSDNVSKINYETGLTIGKATNYDRLNRSSAVRVHNSFIKISDDRVDYYMIKIDYEDSQMNDYEYIVNLRDGLLYIQPLPSDIKATIAITPKSVDYTSGNTFTISNQKLNSELANPSNTKGYIAEQDFKLVATGSNNDIKYDKFNGVEPTYAYKGDLGKAVEKNIVDEDDKGNNSENGKSSILVRILIIGVIVIGSFFFIKSKKKKNHR